MPFLLLLALTLVCLQRDWPEPPAWLGPLGSAVITWTFVALSCLIAQRMAQTLRRRALVDVDKRSALMQRCAKYRRRHFFAQLVVFFLAIGPLGWGSTVKWLWLTEAAPLPGVELLILAPLLCSIVLAWSRYYDLERALHELSFYSEPFPGRWRYVGSQTRDSLILIAPPLLLLLVQQSVMSLVPSLKDDDLLLPFFGVGLLCFVFVAIPWLLRLLLGLKPLPPGPLRDRLTQTARRLSFRFSDILVWNTRNQVANAMVTGPLRFLRYIILTDRLINELSTDEIEAVFGHEVGHVKHHHMLFYFGFLLASLMVLVILWNTATDFLEHGATREWLVEYVPGLEEWLQTYQFAAQLLLVALLGAYIFVVFGFLSRRCERQADVFGCRTVSCTTFIDTLEKVARLNGIPRDRPGWLSSWQHSTIAKRIAFLEHLERDPAIEPSFQRHVGFVKIGAILALGAALFVLGLLLGPDKVWGSLKQL